MHYSNDRKARVTHSLWTLLALYASVCVAADFNRDCGMWGDTSNLKFSQTADPMSETGAHFPDAKSMIVIRCFATKSTGCPDGTAAEAHYESYEENTEESESSPAVEKYKLVSTYPLSRIFSGSQIRLDVFYSKKGMGVVRYREGVDPEGDLCVGTVEAQWVYDVVKNAEFTIPIVDSISPQVVKVEKETEFGIFAPPTVDVEVLNTNCEGDPVASVTRGMHGIILIKPSQQPVPLHSLCFKNAADDSSIQTKDTFLALGPRDFFIEPIATTVGAANTVSFRVFGPLDLKGSSIYITDGDCNGEPLAGTTIGTISASTINKQEELATTLKIDSSVNFHVATYCVAPAGPEPWRKSMCLMKLPPALQTYARDCTRTNSCAPSGGSTSSSSSSSGLSSGGVAAIVILVLLAAGAAGGYYLYRRRHMQAATFQQPMSDVDAYAALTDIN